MSKPRKTPKTSPLEQRILLTPEELFAFWKALNAPVKLTDAQKRLGSLMRGER